MNSEFYSTINDKTELTIQIKTYIYELTLYKNTIKISITTIYEYQQNIISYKITTK